LVVVVVVEVAVVAESGREGQRKGAPRENACSFSGYAQLRAANVAGVNVLILHPNAALRRFLAAEPEKVHCVLKAR
jgi:hypothetical protein